MQSANYYYVKNTNYLERLFEPQNILYQFKSFYIMK